MYYIQLSVYITIFISYTYTHTLYVYMYIHVHQYLSIGIPDQSLIVNNRLTSNLRTTCQARTRGYYARPVIITERKSRGPHVGTCAHDRSRLATTVRVCEVM